MLLEEGKLDPWVHLVASFRKVIIWMPGLSSVRKKDFSAVLVILFRDDSELVPDSKYKVLFSGRTKGEIYCTEVWSQIMRSLSLRAEFQ